MQKLYDQQGIQVFHGDCREVMDNLTPNTFHALITDPPYGLGAEPDALKMLQAWLNADEYTHNGAGFMGKDWDKFVPGPMYWQAAKRILKPGANAFIFGGTRTYDLLTLALRIAQFSIRDCLMWLYSQGFKHGADISKLIDKHLGVERETVKVEYKGEAFYRMGGQNTRPWIEQALANGYHECASNIPASAEAQHWEGYHTLLKPAWEPIVLATKPREGSFAHNALTHGVAGLNIDACRLPTTESKGWQSGGHPLGRYPANVFMDTEVGTELNEQVGRDVARFFYCAKASRAEKNQGCECLPERSRSTQNKMMGHNEQSMLTGSGHKRNNKLHNHHPTVKPLALMNRLVKLAHTPQECRIIDPFMGSGSTLVAALQQGIRAVGIDNNREYCEIAIARISAT